MPRAQRKQRGAELHAQHHSQLKTLAIAIHLFATLFNAERYPELDAKARELIAQYPDSGVGWKALGASLSMQGKDALHALQRAAQLLPHDAETHNNLGNELRSLGYLDDALASCLRALQIKPDFAEAHNNLGNVFIDLGQSTAALTSYRQALEINPQYAEAHANLGVALRQLGRTNEAHASCLKALDIKPDFAMAITNLASLCADHGRFVEAEKLFKRAISIAPNLSEAWSGIPQVRKMTARDKSWLSAAQRVMQQRLPPRKEAQLHYAIAKYFDDIKGFKQAFSHYRCANEIAKRYTPKYDQERMTQAVDQIIQSYDREWLSQTRTDANTSARPIFIVGMPRSGTTLVEQILASHPAVFGAGELDFWTNASATYQPTALDAQTNESPLKNLAHDYLQQLQGLSVDAQHVVDKMPSNFQHLGLINAALPNARIIHMQRNPIDTCLSIYFQNFNITHTYAVDLEDLAHCYNEYRRVMEHWRSTLPAGTILEVPYEGLVEDQEVWSRKMLEFVGLQWSPQCIDFHQTPRMVLTASSWHPRQKISTASVERWRNYEMFIEPLRHLLSLMGYGSDLDENSIKRLSVYR